MYACRHSSVTQLPLADLAGPSTMSIGYNWVLWLQQALPGDAGFTGKICASLVPRKVPFPLFLLFPPVCRLGPALPGGGGSCWPCAGKPRAAPGPLSAPQASADRSNTSYPSAVSLSGAQNLKTSKAKLLPSTLSSPACPAGRAGANRSLLGTRL